MIAGRYYLKRILILISLSFIFLMWGNGILSLTSPDEVFYVQTAKEMIQHRSWLTPYLFDQPQFEKPILSFWLFKAGFMLFGISSFSARLFPALFAMIGVIAVYLLGLLAVKEEKKAFLSALILTSSGLYIGLARTVFTDMIFSVFILLSLLSFFWGYSDKAKKAYGSILFFIFSGLAVLTKGPLGLVIPILIVIYFLAAKKDIRFLYCREFLGWGLLIFMAIALPWYIYMFKRYGYGFIAEFFYNDHLRRFLAAEHPSADKWYFYPASIIGSVFPWSIFTLCALFSLPNNLRKENASSFLFLTSWIAVVFLIFQFCHSKLTSYIVPLFPPLSIITADFIYYFIAKKEKSRSVFNPFLITAIIFLIIGLCLGAGSFIILGRFADYISFKPSVYILSLSWLLLATLFAIRAFRHNYARGLYLLPCFMLTFFPVFPFVAKDVEPFVTSKEMGAYLLNNYKVEGTIICAKPLIRGVRYYTGKPVALYGGNFFSPHPVPYLDMDYKLIGFLQKQPVTFAILTKSKSEDIAKTLDAQKEFKVTLLKIIGNEYLVRINRSN
ncbi:MAG TPA: glycosyltransferase family 39 protein [Candidatus Margulisiibacteriota bacterium]|nr:glycosyltransferase family 39 protein [Candidatus Margulisiibacteriota bacterium]